MKEILLYERRGKLPNVSEQCIVYTQGGKLLLLYTQTKVKKKSNK